MVASLWNEARSRSSFPRLVDDLKVDVLIIGAGYTGLWTALEIVESSPGTRVAVVDKEFVGFGASGRNGGWCSSILPMDLDRLATRHGADSAHGLQQMMFDVVHDIGATTSRLGIDCDYALGGTLSLIRNSEQRVRADAEIAQSRRHGFGDDHVVRLSPEETSRRIRVPGRPESNFQSHCAALHPRKLVDGLARALVTLGVEIYEHTTIRKVNEREAATDFGRITADSILLCTEAYTATLPGRRRRILPLYSMMIATDPLPSEIWDEIGLDDRTTFADFRHLIIYGQRTADGRLAFGGRGAPYHFASRIEPSFDSDEEVKMHLITELRALFPALSTTRFSHHWGGPLAVPRDWSFSVDYDPVTGLGHAGGYVGDGVATSRLAGCTLADLVLGRRSKRTVMPFVGHRSPMWEPEPIRWLSVNGLASLAARMDRLESRDRRPSRLVRSVLGRLTGG